MESWLTNCTFQTHIHFDRKHAPMVFSNFLSDFRKCMYSIVHNPTGKQSKYTAKQNIKEILDNLFTELIAGKYQWSFFFWKTW